MKYFIKNIIQSLRAKKEAKRIAEQRRWIEFCIKGSDIKYEDLTPIPADEYETLLKELEIKAKNEKTDAPLYKCEPWTLPSEKMMRRAQLHSLYAWSEIIDSMKHIREAYYIKQRPCGKCGMDNTIFFRYRSSKQSWKSQCGREGYMLICSDCLTVIGFRHYKMN